MKSNANSWFLVLLSGFIFFTSIISLSSTFYNISDGKANYPDENDDTRSILPKSSWYDNSADPIYIDGSATGVGAHNWSWAGTQEWCRDLGFDRYLIENITIDAGGSGSGIYINNSNVYITIQNCTINNSGNGDMDAGIKFENTNLGSIINNTCSNNGRSGICLYNCMSDTISGNTITDNPQNGIYLKDCYSSGEGIVISGNSVIRNSCGLNMTDCNEITIKENAIYYNDQHGIIVYSNCIDNKIFFNYFIGNEINALVDPSAVMVDNDWDNGEFGNYWDDYSGSDLFPRDGIGDTEYYISGDGTDGKPLIDNLLDIDGDSFCDGDELSYGTDLLDPSWYPMPNLCITDFSSIHIYEQASFSLDYSITNDGIWTAEGIIFVVRCEELDLILYNNTDNPFNLDVDNTKFVSIECSPIYSIGTFQIELLIDPYNVIDERYSQKNGTLRNDWESDNSQQVDITIISLSSISRNDGGDYIIFLLILCILLTLALIIIIVRNNKKISQLKQLILSEKSKTPKDISERQDIKSNITKIKNK